MFRLLGLLVPSQLVHSSPSCLYGGSGWATGSSSCAEVEQQVRGGGDGLADAVAGSALLQRLAGPLLRERVEEASFDRSPSTDTAAQPVEEVKEEARRRSRGIDASARGEGVGSSQSLLSLVTSRFWSRAHARLQGDAARMTKIHRPSTLALVWLLLPCMVLLTLATPFCVGARRREKEKPREQKGPPTAGRISRDRRRKEDRLPDELPPRRDSGPQEDATMGRTTTAHFGDDNRDGVDIHGCRAVNANAKQVSFEPTPLSTSPPDRGRSPGQGDGERSKHHPGPQQQQQRHLCPDLVVPASFECHLVLPLWPTVSKVPWVIRGADGNAVVQALIEYLPSPTRAAQSPPTAGSFEQPGLRQQQQGVQIVLQTPLGEPLARCWTNTQREFWIHRSNDAYFATLTRSSSHKEYLLSTTNADGDLEFSGSLAYEGVWEVHRAGATKVDEGSVVASTERCEPETEGGDAEPNFTARLVSGADVGLMVCCFLCTQLHVEHTG